LKNAMRHQPVGSALRLYLFGRFAECQSFCLRKNVGQKHVVVTPQRSKWVHKRDKVTLNQSCALMNQLIERMLSVSPGLAPQDRTGVIVDPLSIKGDVLAVALHR